MKDIDVPLYSSSPTIKSMHNKYSIFADRVELEHRFFFGFRKTLIINKEDILSIGVYKPFPPWGFSLFSLKLDWCDLNEHVGIARRGSFLSKIRFTPKNPMEFVAKAKELWGIGQ